MEWKTFPDRWDRTGLTPTKIAFELYMSVSTYYSDLYVEAKL